MSSPSELFECRCRPSVWLLRLYLLALLLALVAPWLSSIALGWKLLAHVLCFLHVAWVLPRRVLLSSPHAFTGLRRNAEGWQLWSAAAGWQAVQLRPDSLALPAVVVLRFSLPGQRLVRGLCIPADALPADQHRRLRVLLKFSRRRWTEPGSWASG
ncbi:protein YgfX [Pseudomonas sp. NCCP-436]|uniref:protein YgfX n=1 Tax=Pseudomonas sp. NCCP-436 TaxID=2842481 RepID=UPI001C7ED6B6|nr:protein YgfX [Pseudomonas sp. NCCP-436]GIZ11136.1 hypothetical protein NCCP436_05520 [Pseudomonas sp. NCCP-436]